MCAAALLVPAVPALAQTGGSDELKGRLFLHFEGQSMTAKDSFDAVTGSSTVTGIGVGLDVHNVWRSLFIRAAISKLNVDGERVFVDDGDVFKLGIPIEVKMTPIELGAGWRFKPIGSRAIVPYLGGGPLFFKHREESEGDDPEDRVNETHMGLFVFGGLEVPVVRHVSAGAELGYRSAKVDSPGGAMRLFGESNLGGVTFRVMVSFKN
jgi:hypothetical protein